MTKFGTTLMMALAVALSATMWNSSASAAAGRDAAIEKCVAQAHKRFGGMYYNFDQNRTFVYADCMHDAGQPR